MGHADARAADLGIEALGEPDAPRDATGRDQHGSELLVAGGIEADVTSRRCAGQSAAIAPWAAESDAPARASVEHESAAG